MDGALSQHANSENTVGETEELVLISTNLLMQKLTVQAGLAERTGARVTPPPPGLMGVIKMAMDIG